MFVYVVIRSKKLAEWSRALHRVKGKDIVNEWLDGQLGAGGRRGMLMRLGVVFFKIVKSQILARIKSHILTRTHKKAVFRQDLEFLPYLLLLVNGWSYNIYEISF